MSASGRPSNTVLIAAACVTIVVVAVSVALLRGVRLASFAWMNPIYRPIARANAAANLDPQSASAFSPPVPVSLLESVQGEWQFDFERTMARWKAQGVSPGVIERTRDFNKQMQSQKASPQEEAAVKAFGLDVNTWRKTRGNLHQDLKIEGHVATGWGLPSAEYRFFGLHEHDGVVCGKAWHHEDRWDYGDMSKCHVRLQVVRGELWLDVRMQEDLDIEDPELTDSTILLDSAADCDAPDGAESHRNDWTTYVFVRSAEESGRWK
jgi:hypothetical protein